MSTDVMCIKKRVEWIDCAKGIGILLVIIGHCLTDEMALFAIHSFHMPLFFILSVATFRYSENNDQFLTKTEKAFRHLILPYLLCFLYSVCWSLVKNKEILMSKSSLKEFASDRILQFVFASGMPVNVGGVSIRLIGLTWFFVVLFISRTLFDYVQYKLHNEKKLILFCCISSGLGVVLGKIQQLPFSLDICLAIMPFLYVGGKIKNRLEEKWQRDLLLSTILWIALFVVSSDKLFNLAARYYPGYPLCFVTAIVGAIMVCTWSIGLCKVKLVARPLVYFGKNSLYMMCIHVLDYSLLKCFWDVSSNLYIRILLRLTVDIVALSLVVFIQERIRGYKLKM